MRSASHATSLSPSAEVASSSRSTRGLRSTARTISSICCRPSGRSPTIAPGSTSRRWRARISFAVCAGAGARDAAPGANRRGGEQEVALDAQLTHQGQFLEHARDALADRVIGVAQSELLAVESDGSVIRNNRAADDLDQGRFAGAVFSSEAKDGSARRLKRDRFQRAGCAEGLFDPRQGQHGLGAIRFREPGRPRLRRRQAAAPRAAPNCPGKRAMATLPRDGRQKGPSLVRPQGRAIISSCRPESSGRDWRRVYRCPRPASGTGRGTR